MVGNQYLMVSSGALSALYKDVTQCSNYKGITFLSIICKIFSGWIIHPEYCRTIPMRLHFRQIGDRLPWRERVRSRRFIGSPQWEIRWRRWIMDFLCTAWADQIFFLWQSMEKLLEYVHQLSHVFIDSKAVYDSILRIKQFAAMGQLGIPTRLIGLTRETLINLRK